METKDIPSSVTVATGLYAAVYTSDKNSKSATWSWYPPHERRDTWPHMTVGTKDDVHDTIPLGHLPLPPDESGATGPPVNLRKLWWYKLHVSVPIGGANLHLYYTIDNNWSLATSGNSIKDLTQQNRTLAQPHVNRQATDYKEFAEAFIQGARSAWEASIVARRSPTTTKVGPQTGRAFARGDGL